MGSSSFDSVLIANRGEIALRVIRACRALGIESIAVHSDVDADALHVRSANRSFSLGGTDAASSYLNLDALRTAMERSGAQAVHPGYGFLSEDPALASMVTGLGAVFVGPSADVIATMGNKVSARIAAQAAGIPVVPGTSTAVQDGHEILDFAAEFGFPVAIKAAHGGGGRGIKVVEDAASIEAALAAARREALAYFGNAEVYVERFFSTPRHVEVQVLADHHGHVVWLGDRDCSVQRRHQKLVEEGPSSLPEGMRRAMGESAAALARSVGYTNAGTVEFLAEGEDFWFLEMNTRIQVEHPVTEMVTGVDLVAEQLRIASGAELAHVQEDISVSGHAIELRINAEDPDGGGFVPSPGTLTAMAVQVGDRVRFDTGYEPGDDVSPYFDNLVGKLVVWATNRVEAIEVALDALETATFQGVATTAPAHALILSHPDFRADRHHTRWLDTEVQFGPDVLGDAVERARSRRRFVRLGNDLLFVPTAAGASSDSSVDTPPADIGPVPERGELGSTAVVVPADHTVRSPMQGTVIEVAVSQGEEVPSGTKVCVIEAMKMENQVRVEWEGVVHQVFVSVGDLVAPGDPVVQVEETGSAER